MTKRRKISPKRKQAFNTGTILMGIGLILFLSSFVISFAGFGSGRMNVGGIMGPSIIGFILIFIGQTMRKVGRNGLAGSGIILDMEQEKQDMEPINRMKGGQINDTLDEIDFKSHFGGGQKEVIKIRCTKCKYLNDEKDKFCGNCGSPI